MLGVCKRFQIDVGAVALSVGATPLEDVQLKQGEVAVTTKRAKLLLEDWTAARWLISIAHTAGMEYTPQTYDLAYKTS